METNVKFITKAQDKLAPGLFYLHPKAIMTLFFIVGANLIACKWIYGLIFQSVCRQSSDPAVSVSASQTKIRGETGSNVNLPIMLKRLCGANCLGIF